MLTDLILKKRCPVKTCMYHSVVTKSGCCSDYAEDMSLEELAEHKGIPNVSAIFREKNKRIRDINGILLLDEFLDWSDKFTPKKISHTKVNAFYKAAACSNVLKSREITWTMERITKVLSKKLWSKFWEEHKNANIVELHNILGLTKRELQSLTNEYKEKS